jgi:hypothetical protein
MIINKLLLSTALVFVSLSAKADPLPSLDIGDDNTYENYYLTLGESNYVTGNDSIAVGFNNQGGFTSSMVLGSWNHSWGAWNSLELGSYNDVDSAYNSLIVGSHNLGNYSNPGENTDSLISGSYNSGYLISGFIAGRNNYGQGEQFILGEGLLAQTSPLMVVAGKYNATPAADQLFVIGNGYVTQNGNQTVVTRRNALEVKADGTITVPKRQGDIRMGRFGNTGDQ